MKSFSLIVPIAADKPIFEHEMPYVFGLAGDGIMICIKAILGLNLERFDSIYFTILKKHDELFFLSDLFNFQFKRLNLRKAKVVVLEESTSSQPETIYKTIQKENISGSIFIKDADCSFSCDVEPINSVAIYPLEQLEMVNPQHKSYVAVDDMNYITNIIEKKIVSNYFCAGGYCFEDVQLYCQTYNTLSEHKCLYLSHIIFFLMLEKNNFRPIHILEYNDFEAI